MLNAPFRLLGEQVMLSTVDPGDHFELSTVTFTFDGAWRDDRVHARLKIDAIDLHDRNPTDTDNEVDVDEAWLRFGREREPGDLAMASGVFLKIGKMPAFERQDDRHLESYGLVSTAFNRMEDIGLELGWRAGKHLWGRVTVSEGNPLFFRDPTALAGDNGTRAEVVEGRRPEFGTGLGILYDAETEDLSFDEPEVGIGIGLRFGDDTGHRALDILAWARRRQLQDTVDLVGTEYGGDLDILDGPFNGPPGGGIGNPFSFAITDDDKREVGFNLWYYHGGFSLFLQAVDADTAGLGREAYEAELAYIFELPLVAASAGKQWFSTIQPAIRYSKIEPDFGLPPVGSFAGIAFGRTPSPSFAWEWEKLDVGIRIDIWNGLDLTAEYALNRFVVGGNDIENNETLVTLRYRFD